MENPQSTAEDNVMGGGKQMTPQDEAVGREVAPAAAPTDSTPVEYEAAPSHGEEDPSAIAIRFVARPDGFYLDTRISPYAASRVVTSRLQAMLMCPTSHIILSWEGRPVRSLETIADIAPLPDVDDRYPLVIDMEFDPVPEHLTVLAPGDNAMYALGVQVRYSDQMPVKSFHVTVVRGFDNKPFLGGFRHKKTEAIFHHATTQCTSQQQQEIDNSHKVSKMTQTQGKTRSCQTRRECATQMSRPDLLVDETYDRVVIAKPYFSADKLRALQINKSVQLQACVRGWRARRIAKQLRQERDEVDMQVQLEDIRRKEEHTKKRLEEIDRRTHPRTAQDFALLHNELEAWRLQEVKRIEEANLSPEEKRIAMVELLKKQTKLLQTIDRLQQQASKDNKAKRVNTVLNKMSSAKAMPNLAATSVETPLTIRARELRDLYNGLQLAHISADERLDVLLHVKWTVKEFECVLTREIVELIDREADLLNRGRKASTMAGLRQRLNNLFLQFIETPEFNPEALQYSRVPIEHTHRPLVKLTKK